MPVAKCTVIKKQFKNTGSYLAALLPVDFYEKAAISRISIRSTRGLRNRSKLPPSADCISLSQKPAPARFELRIDKAAPNKIATAPINRELGRRTVSIGIAARTPRHVSLRGERTQQRVPRTKKENLP